MNTENKYLTAAVILGPLMIYPALAIPSLFRLYWVNPEGFNFLNGLIGSLATATVALIPGYLLTILFGLPVFLFLRKRNKQSLLNIMLLSLVPVAIASVTNSSDPLATFIGYGYFSIIVGFACWVVACWLPKKALTRQSKATP